MKCFTFALGLIQEGIGVNEHPVLGPVVRLGQEDGEGKVTMIRLFRRNPAQVENHRIFDAHPVRITTTRTGKRVAGVFFVLAKPKKDADPRVLVRISSRQPNCADSPGYWEFVEGLSWAVGFGFGRSGETQRSRWDDGLIVMSPGDVIRVKPAGLGAKPYAVHCHPEDRVLRSMPFDQERDKPRPSGRGPIARTVWPLSTF